MVDVNRITTFIRDYVAQSRMDGIVIGMSGGIDSIVAASLSIKAIGPDKVTAVLMPSAHTEKQAMRDVVYFCEDHNVEYMQFNIQPILDVFMSQFKDNIDNWFEPSPLAVANLAPRTRMMLLYSVANTKNRLVCGTSNRTEYLLGYFTKWGDGAADIEPLIHLLKREVYNAARELEVPQSFIDRVPTAGLWPNQTDEGEIGMSYAEMDANIEALDVKGWTFPINESEKKVIYMHERTEHKRNPIPDPGDG
jgi:NAD+ synthase